MGIVDTLVDVGLAKVLDSAGLGANKKVGFSIPNVTLDQAENIIAYIATQNKWGLIRKENQSNLLIIVLQVGQWGLSINGSQRLSFVLQSTDSNVKGIVTSKSRMGQLIDRGTNQKNIDTFIKLLESIINNPQSILNIESHSISFPKSKSAISPWFYVISSIIPLAILIYTFFYIRSINDSLRSNSIKFNNEFQNNLNQTNQLLTPSPIPATNSGQIASQSANNIPLIVHFNIRKDGLTDSQIKQLPASFGASDCQVVIMNNLAWTFNCFNVSNPDQVISNAKKNSQVVSAWADHNTFQLSR